MDTIFCKGVFTIDTFNFVPHRDVKISFQFNHGVTSFYSGAKQINRHRIHAEKLFSFTVSGLKEEMDALIAFYNAQHGMKKEFLFVYDGIEEHCFFAEAISVSAIRELKKVVGYEANVKLACAYQVSPYRGHVSTEDTLNITPKDKVEHKIDWNTKVVSMIYNARQETYIEPTETFTVNLVGVKEQRDELIRMFNLHGSIPFTFTFDGKDYRVRFPDSIEITDKRVMAQIQGFECKLDLEVVKAPNNGNFYDENYYNNQVAIIVKPELSLYRWYENGCMIDGKCYKNDLKKLQGYRITNCYEAFANSTDIVEIPELDTSKCTTFSRMFQKSSVRIINGLDFSEARYADYMFDHSRVIQISAPLTFPKCVSADYMFMCVKGFRNIPYITMPISPSCYRMFYGADIDSVSGFYFPLVTNYNAMFSTSTVVSVPTIDLNGVQEADLMFSSCSNLKSVNFINCNSLKNVQSMFASCSQLSSVTGLNLTKVQSDYHSVETDNLYGVFQYCQQLKNITIIEEALSPGEAFNNKYYALMMNYGMLDGRYASRFIEHLIIVNKQGQVIERYDKYGNGRNDWE